MFTEVLVAPAFEPDALEIAECEEEPAAAAGSAGPAAAAVESRPISGGMLLQTADRIDAPGDDPASWQLAAGPPPTTRPWPTWPSPGGRCRAVKSNAILLASDGATVGVGMGQVNRVDSCRLAVSRAGERAAGSVAASDAFFPFADGPQVLLDAGVRAVVAARRFDPRRRGDRGRRAAGVTMYFTGTRHFAH